MSASVRQCGSAANLFTFTDQPSHPTTHQLIPTYLTVPNGNHQAGLKPGVPTMFTFEAVLFYLEPDAVQGLMNSLTE